ncbi:hypothetical protein QBC46DRAFT_169477 [Diplogelasinospora grovesii]|uniref:Uncharacterized protein n=1 Tax=Diplogelasinospora grovesii TaxID=303347 RepID=A0AAN6N321_9PEZI|nr:hypothetical protein QBC46DRAFT_169477 [Diplogelasinospora grovesii]
MSQPAVITPHDDDNGIIKSQKVHLVLSSASTNLVSEGNLWSTTKLWNVLSLSVCMSIRGDTIATATATKTSGRSVAFSLPTPEGSEISQARGSLSDTVGLGVALTSTWSERKCHNIGNLCQALRRSRKQGVGECCGQIYDGSSPYQSRAYEVYPLGSPNGSTSSILVDRAPGPLSDYETLMGLMDQINRRMGSNYCSAVKRCINCDYHQGSVGFGDGPRKDVLVGVLTLLEQDWRVRWADCGNYGRLSMREG